MSEDFESNRDKYGQSYSDGDLQAKLRKGGFGKSLLSKVYILYEVLKSSETPMFVKAGIIAVLGYFISPIDVIPDILPVVGYSDDLALVVGELAAIASYVTPEIETVVARKL